MALAIFQNWELNDENVCFGLATLFGTCRELYEKFSKITLFVFKILFLKRKNVLKRAFKSVDAGRLSLSTFEEGLFLEN